MRNCFERLKVAVLTALLGCEAGPQASVTVPVPATLPAKVDGAIAVHPGHGIGAVRVAMTATEVRTAVRLTRHPASSGLTTLPYTFHWSPSGHVQGVAANVTRSTQDFRVGEAWIPAGADLARVVELLGDCVDRSDDIEKNFACRAGAVRVTEGPNFPGEAWLEVGSRFVGEMTPAQVVAQRSVLAP